MNELTDIIAVISPLLSGFHDGDWTSYVGCQISSAEYVFIDNEVDFVLFIGIFNDSRNIKHSKIAYFMEHHGYK